MMQRAIPRRRFIGITAAAAGLSLLPFRNPSAEASLAVWRGTALGASASLQIHHEDRRVAEQLLERSVQELRRLEALFSLYQDDSVLVELNRRGVIVAPPREFVDLLEACDRYVAATGGRFDPTVQPLWEVHVRHFETAGAASSGPSDAEVDAARRLVGWEHVLVSEDRIAFGRKGMGLTLNGIAQGYITDRVADLLSREGISRSMIDLGEARALGSHPDGHPWRVGLADPVHPERIAEEVALTEGAVATSAPYGFRFDSHGRFNHLFEPQTGGSAYRYHSVSVLAKQATEADALSTAFSFMSSDEITRTLKNSVGGRAYVATREGTWLIL